MNRSHLETRHLSAAALWLAVLGAAVPSPARAEVIPLAALEQKALGERPELAQHGARIEGARAELRKARSGYYPQLSAEASSGLGPTRQLLKVDQPDGQQYQVLGSPTIEDSEAFAPQVRYGVDLELRAPLYDFGRTAAAVRARQAQRAAAEAGHSAAKNALRKTVRGAYLGWLRASELLALMAREAEDAEARKQRIEALIAEGARPEAERTPAESEALLAALELERAQAALERARLLLEQLVGAPLPATAEPDRSLLEAAAVIPGPSEDDPTLRALERQRKAASDGARAEEKQSAPLLSAAVSAGVQAQDLDIFPRYTVGVALKVPLWDGGRARASADAARAQATELDARIEEHRQQQSHAQQRRALEASQAGRLLKRAQALLSLSQKQLADAEQAMELGVADPQTVAGARTMLRRAEREVVLAKVARAETRLRLMP
ncbi:MAG: TolC family protein [Myxococcales bacterium]|nr:TolC family protein [Myxococcales bacterium]